MRRQDFLPGMKFGMATILKEVEPNITPCGTKQVKRSIETGLPDSHGEYWVLKDNYNAD